uniref:Methylosome subunit pICln n=1 Tax=Panagrolaimus superbus TaxID=310955 RepID=A0A914XYS3_9BILA
MIDLKHLSPPVDQVFAEQENVVAFWESQSFGIGTLYLTAHTVTWMNPQNMGFLLTYPSIAVHAASGATEQYPDPSLFLLVDVAKTDIVVHSDPDGVEDDDSEDEVKTASIRFVPQEPGAISHLYQTMNTCQELNPDPKDDMDSTTDEEADEDDVSETQESPYISMNGAGGDTGFGNQWYTAENINDGVHLNDEGIANLTRMLRGSRTDDGENGQQHHNSDEAMDE